MKKIALSKTIALVVLTALFSILVGKIFFATTFVSVTYNTTGVAYKSVSDVTLGCKILNTQHSYEFTNTTTIFFNQTDIGNCGQIAIVITPRENRVG